MRVSSERSPLDAKRFAPGGGQIRQVDREVRRAAGV